VNMRIVAFLILLVSSVASTAQGQINLSAFDFTSADGNQIRLPLYPGKPSLIVLWDSRNNTHREALLRLKSVQPSLQQRGLSIVVVEVSSASVSGRRWLDDSRLGYHFILEKPGAHSLSATVASNQELVFLCADARGSAIVIHRGYTRGDEYAIRSKCENLLR